MALFQNLFGPPQPPGMTPAAPALPRVPWAQNPMVTTAALSLLGGRNLNEGLANVAATAGQGMQAKAGLQAFMLAQQEKQAAKSEADARKAQMNDVIKNWSGLSPEQRALFSAQPELFGQYAMGTMTPEKPMVVGKDSQIYDPASKTWTGPPGGGAPDPASITNVTAFSPTDTMPLTRWAKAMMTVQAAVGLSTLVLVQTGQVTRPRVFCVS